MYLLIINKCLINFWTNSSSTRYPLCITSSRAPTPQVDSTAADKQYINSDNMEDFQTSSQSLLSMQKG